MSMMTTTVDGDISRLPGRRIGFGHRLPTLSGVLAGVLTVFSALIYAEETPITLKIRNHQFSPNEIEIPAGEKRQLHIENEDATAEEFESHTLHREKIIPAHSAVNLFIGPLKPGRYEFVGEFNSDTAKGTVVAK